jgi:uncharacterized protein
MLGAFLFSTAADAGRPSKEGDPPPPWSMRTYIVAFLYRGPTRPADDKAGEEIQRGHLAHLARLIEQGKLLIVGPLLDKTELRGICVFDSTSAEEVQSLCDADPAIRAGTLRSELHPWYAAKGLGIVKAAERG